MEHEFPSFAFGHGVCVMLTPFERAFFRGRISLLLLRLWTEKNIVPQGSPVHVRMLGGDILSESRVVVLFFCLATTLLIIGIFFVAPSQGLSFLTCVFFLVNITFAVNGLSLKKKLRNDRRNLSKHIFKRLSTAGSPPDTTCLRPDKQFLKDAEELYETLGVCNVCTVGKDELIHMAEKRLWDLTQLVLDAEKRGERDNWNHAEASNAVKKAYGIFSRFGLTQDPLGEYYKKPTVVRGE